VTNFHMLIHYKNEKWMVQIPSVEKCINWDGWHIFTNVAYFNQRLCISDDDYIEHGLMTYIQDVLDILWRYCGNLNGYNWTTFRQQYIVLWHQPCMVAIIMVYTYCHTRHAPNIICNICYNDNTFDTTHVNWTRICIIKFESLLTTFRIVKVVVQRKFHTPKWIINLC
jgi:hypothetical protein